MIAPFAILTRTRTLLVVAMIVFLVVGNGACRRGSNRNTNANAGATSSESETAADKSKREAQAIFNQGKEFYRNDQDEQAAKAFQEAIRISPDLAEAHLRL